MELHSFGKLKYFIKKPISYKPGEKYPCIFFLHGAGSRGTDPAQLISNPFFTITKEFKDFPFVVVAPLCHEDSWFCIAEQLQNLAKHTAKLSFVDPCRFYCMGASMGGYGTWMLSCACPDLFAAIVPVCGGGMPWNAYRLKDMPIWAFHGGKDTCVLPSESINMVDAANKGGAKAKITIYPENSHDAWTDTYKNAEVYSFLLSHSKKENLSYEDNFKNNSAVYG